MLKLSGSTEGSKKGLYPEFILHREPRGFPDRLWPGLVPKPLHSLWSWLSIFSLSTGTLDGKNKERHGLLSGTSTST